MQTRTLGRTGWQVSEIGLGTEYLLNQPPEVMAGVMQAAVEAGINVMDLLYNGPRFWNAFTPIMQQHRNRMIVAAHWGVGEQDGQLENVRDQAVCQRFFDDTLRRLGNDYADIAMLMMVDTDALWDSWGLDSVERLQRYKQQGRIGAIGLSSHKAATALKAITSGLIDVLMFPINLASHAVAGNSEIYAACARQNVGLIAMKPFAGGVFFLGEQSVRLYWYHSGGAGLQVDKPQPITPTQCLSYVLSQPVSTVVPGVKNAGELAAALHYLEASDAEKDVSAAIAGIRPAVTGQCCYCNHCLPCPQGIDIGQTIRLIDTAQGQPTADLRQAYMALPMPASACSECGACVERCPYEVDIPLRMRQAAALFE